ncbi:MAG: hypothetical protein QM660_06105 [Dysgonomonas sp.]
MRKIYYLLVLSAIAFFATCSSDIVEESENSKTSEIISDYPFYPSLARKMANNASQTKAGVPDPKKATARWDDNQEIKVFFLNGNPTVQAKVKEIATTYEELTNIKFQYVADRSLSDVRIQFSNHGTDSKGISVNWSYLGRQCLDINKSDPTMNLAIKNITDLGELNSTSFKASVLREFGHLLGMIYEYQRSNINNPKERVVLNEDYIYDLVEYQNNWTEYFQIDNSILNEHFYIANLLDSTSLASNEFDETSIMLPYIPKEWLKVGNRPTQTSFEMAEKVACKTNIVLSENDKKYIAAIYPKTEPTPYKPGKVGSVFMELDTESGLIAWDYRINQAISGNKILNNYNTRGIGEYEWTAENLRIKYKDSKYSTSANDIKYLLANGCGTDHDINIINRFEQIYGSWVYNHHTTYRNKYKFTRLNGEISGPVNFQLPDSIAIVQLLGQMPAVSSDLKANLKRFIIGIPEKEICGINREVINSKTPWLAWANETNISKLGVMPLGTKNFTNTYPTGKITGFGASFAWKTLDSYKYQYSLFIVADYLQSSPIMYFSVKNGGWGSTEAGQVRYCRAFTDNELGYRLYIDKINDKIIISRSLNVNNELEQLPRGLERGIALRYINWDKEICVKKWSEILSESREMKKKIKVYYTQNNIQPLL